MRTLGYTQVTITGRPPRTSSVLALGSPRSSTSMCNRSVTCSSSSLSSLPLLSRSSSSYQSLHDWDEREGREGGPVRAMTRLVYERRGYVATDNAKAIPLPHHTSITTPSPPTQRSFSHLLEWFRVKSRLHVLGQQRLILHQAVRVPTQYSDHGHHDLAVPPTGLELICKTQ